MERFTVRAAIYVLLEKNNKVLMFKRKNTNWYDGYLNVPSGHIDGRETLRTAAVREVKEEVGVDIRLDDLDFIQMVHRVSNGDQGYSEYLDAYFKIDKWQGEPFLAEKEMSEELGWFDIDNLPENTLPYIKEAIQSAKAGNLYCESGWK